MLTNWWAQSLIDDVAPLAQILVECPSIGHPYGNDVGQVSNRVHLCGTLGTIIEQHAARDPRDVPMSEHCPGGSPLLAKGDELARNRHIEAGLLLDDSNRGILGSLTRIARIAGKRCWGIDGPAQRMNQDNLALAGLDYDEGTVIITIRSGRVHNHNLGGQRGEVTKLA